MIDLPTLPFDLPALHNNLTLITSFSIIIFNTLLFSLQVSIFVSDVLCHSRQRRQYNKIFQEYNFINIILESLEYHMRFVAPAYK